MSIGEAQDGELRFEDFVLDCVDERLIGPRGPIKIGNKAFKVLLLMAQQNGRLLTKDVLFSSVWDGTIVSESSLTSVIKELRRALGDESRTPRYIESVYGRGYRFIAPVTKGIAMAGSSRGATQKLPAADEAAPHQSDGRREQQGRPPLVLVSRFHDEAICLRHPYCAQELREEVLSGLARVREIQLVANDCFEEEASHSRSGARGYQLIATLLPEGDGVKVIARAKRLNDGLIVWADTMSLADGGTAGGVEKIVRRIVGAALPAVDDDVLLGLPRNASDVYDRYLIAKRKSFVAADFVEAKGAADALERILVERPDFAPAYAPLVRLYNTDFGYTAFGSTGAKERAYALKLAKNGLAADRANAHAHSVLGWCYLWRDERVLSRTSFEQALALNPYNHVRVQEAATAWMYMGDIEGSRSLLERAAELNPNLDDAFYQDLGRLQFIEGDLEAARTSLESVAHGLIWSDLYLGACEIALGVNSGRDRLGEWHERVLNSWRSARPPSREELLRWVGRHNPLPGESNSRLFRLVEAGLPEPGVTARAPRAIR